MAIEHTTKPTVRLRVMFGQVIAADAADGRPRVRVHVGAGPDVMVRLKGSLVNTVPDVLGQHVELSVSETLAGDTVVDRVVSQVRRLNPGECGVDVPARSIDELAREQGLHRRPPPDYFSVLSGLWESEEEAEAFREDIRSGRAAI